MPPIKETGLLSLIEKCSVSNLLRKASSIISKLEASATPNSCETSECEVKLIDSVASVVQEGRPSEEKKDHKPLFLRSKRSYENHEELLGDQHPQQDLP